VLLAYDGSPAAAAAIRAAAALRPGAAALVLTVRPEPLDLHRAMSGARMAIPDEMIVRSVETLNAAAAKEAEETVAAGARVAAEAGLAPDTRLEEQGGNPWRAIRRVADETGAELIACGTRGMGAFSRMTLGSTSSGLLHNAGRPLLVAPEGGGAPGGPVVLGYDGSHSSRAAVALAGRLLAGRDVLVVHVWESMIRHSVSGRALASLPIDEVRELTDDLDAYFRSVAEDVAEEGATLAREAGADARARAVEAAGAPWHGLTAAASTAGASLVIVGSRGRGGLAAGLLGSVSSGLVHEAALPVLVVPGD
jgi:nucleotide-binding universal stress UspA family protein